jgi:hypothetical protein
LRFDALEKKTSSDNPKLTRFKSGMTIKTQIFRRGIMKTITALFSLLISSSVFASTNGYDLKIELSMHGKHVSSPRVTTKEGEVASVTQEANGEKIFMDVIATEKPTNNKQAILMKFVIGTISAEGIRTVVATPQVISIANEKAQITLSNEQGKEDLSVSVIASRKAL